MLREKRLAYSPSIPPLLADLRGASFRPCGGKKGEEESLLALFPHTAKTEAHRLEKGEGRATLLRIGAFFSGGPAAGGHNVLAGLFDALREIDSGSRLIGFLNGPSGLIENRYKELSAKEIAPYRNQGGFDLIGTGRTKIETEEQFSASLQTCQAHALDGLIVIGGDDSNTNAAFLAEYFLEKGAKTRVVGVPKTIDGDLRSDDIELSFGFDTACRTFAEAIGNIARDAQSAGKYYHFIKLMGRSASHIALECALATQPNLALIGEEGKSLRAIVCEIAELICRRFEAKKEYGVFLIPEGLIEFIPEVKALIYELNDQIAKKKKRHTLSTSSKELFDALPEAIQKQLLLERDPHGNVQVSQIATEQLLRQLVTAELKKKSSYKGKFSAQDHFLGYEGRAAFPTNFDANYGYALGRLAAVAVRDQLTGVICAVKGLHLSPQEWELKAIPLLSLMHWEVRKGEKRAVIRKAIVDVKGDSFVYFARSRKFWEIEDCYCYPGPIQFFGERELTDVIPFTLRSKSGTRCSS